MPPTVSLRHQTTYRYDQPVALGPHYVRLAPAPQTRIPFRDYRLEVRPSSHLLHWMFGPAGNRVARIVFPDRIDRLDLTVTMTVTLTPLNPFDFFVEPWALTTPFDYDDHHRRPLQPYLAPDHAGPLLSAWLETIDRTPRNTVEFLVDLNKRLADTIAYSTRWEPGVQTSEQTLEIKIGSCRDTSMLLVQILRHLGFASRFVSGYLIQLKNDQPDSPKEDTLDLHAWAEAFVPGAGWLGMDPTSGMMASEGHIPLAAAVDPMDTAPVIGSASEVESQFQHQMSIERLTS
ncbi:MAG: transglutaminase family protein [Pseudomonadota bacterium]